MTTNENQNTRQNNEDAMHAQYSEEEMSQMTVAQVLDIEKQYGLYCGTCGHGNGCEHGVPFAEY